MICLMPPGADIFESGADVLVNPVDCTGAQGKGLALEFKRRFPLAYARYRRHAQNVSLLAGNVFLAGLDAQTIAFAATKQLWRMPSELKHVKACMWRLVRVLDGRQPSVRSVAIPALGCGLGGLSWDEVLPVIRDGAQPMVDAGVRVMVYPPRKDSIK